MVRDSEQVTVSVQLPSRVLRQIKDKAHKNDTTLRSVVLSALKAAGFEVDESDLIDRRSARGSSRP